MLRALVVLLFASSIALAGDDKSKRYETKDGKASAVFPKKPDHSSKSVRTPTGELKLVALVGAGGNDLSLSITFTDYPQKYAEVDARKLLAAVRDGMKTKDAILEHSDDGQPGRLDGTSVPFPGMEFVYDHHKYVARTRLFLVGTRLYQVNAIGPRREVFSKTAEEFLLSFDVKN